MSHKEVEDSKHRFVPAKTPVPKRGKPTFLDGIKVSKEDNIKNQPVEFHYKDRGEITSDTNGSYAMKREYTNGKTEYFIKFATAGAGVGRMLNPWGVYYTQGDEIKYEKTMGRKRYEFRKVQEQVFNTYLKFLTTKNERYILNAERETNNG